jgi:hypothetical protein
LFVYNTPQETKENEPLDRSFKIVNTVEFKHEEDLSDGNF